MSLWAMDLRESKCGCMGRLGGRKSSRKLCIISEKGRGHALQWSLERTWEELDKGDGEGEMI